MSDVKRVLNNNHHFRDRMCIPHAAWESVAMRDAWKVKKVVRKRQVREKWKGQTWDIISCSTLEKERKSQYRAVQQLVRKQTSQCRVRELWKVWTSTIQIMVIKCVAPKKRNKKIYLLDKLIGKRRKDFGKGFGKGFCYCQQAFLTFRFWYFVNPN